MEFNHVMLVFNNRKAAIESWTDLQSKNNTKHNRCQSLTIDLPKEIKVPVYSKYQLAILNTYNCIKHLTYSVQSYLTKASYKNGIVE